MITTRILLADGWHDVAALTRSTFRSAPGYAALLPGGRRWVFGPVSPLLGIESVMR